MPETATADTHTASTHPKTKEEGTEWTHIRPRYMHKDRLYSPRPKESRSEQRERQQKHEATMRPGLGTADQYTKIK